jgi:archaemetzincin
MLVVCALSLAACQVKDAAGQPGPERKRPAVAAGDTDAPAARDPFAFDPAFFEKKRKPGPSDWLATFHEPGQSFAQYVAQSPKGLTGKRTTIVLQPIGPFSKDELAVLEKLREFTSAFFQLRVRVEKPVPLPDHGKRSRSSGMLKWTQYHTGTLMADVLLPRLHGRVGSPPALPGAAHRGKVWEPSQGSHLDDAVCYLGITMADLYPDPSWNFVFGEATFSRRVGVYSLVRYTNRFWGQPETDESKRLFLQRSFKILAHETGHMFSIAHCTENECLMNGSNSLDETDHSSMHLCPTCLHKLQWNLKLDVMRHYRQLRDIYARAGYADLADWTQRRIVSLESPVAAAAAP